MRTRRTDHDPAEAPAWLAWVIGAFLVAVGAAIGLTANYISDQAQAAKTWPGVEGRIESSRVESRRDRESGTMHSVEVVYTYEVEGKAYKGKNIRPQGMMTYSSSSKSEAQDDAAEYPEGSARTVYYNPSDPADACLVPEAGAGAWVLMAVGIATLLAGAGVLAYKVKAAFVPPPDPLGGSEPL